MSLHITRQDAVELIRTVDIAGIEPLLYEKRTVDTLSRVLKTTQAILFFRYEKTNTMSDWRRMMVKYRHLAVDDRGRNVAHVFYWNILRDIASAYYEHTGGKTLSVSGSMCSGMVTFPITALVPRRLFRYQEESYHWQSDLDLRVEEDDQIYMEFARTRAELLLAAMPHPLQLPLKPEIGTIVRESFLDNDFEPVRLVEPFHEHFDYDDIAGWRPPVPVEEELYTGDIDFG